MRYKLTKAQRSILSSEAPVILAIFGIGGGKSWTASHWIVQRMLKGGHIMATSPTYKQLNLVLFREIQDRLRELGVKYTFNSSGMVLTIPQTDGAVYGFSTDTTSIESARGITVDCAVMDEGALSTDYDFKVISGRCRRGKLPTQKLIITTPRGRANWIYKLTQRSTTDLITQSTFANPFLPEDYLEQLKEEYEGEFARQELYAEFIDADGAQTLIPVKLLKKTYLAEKILEKDQPIVIGLDVARYGNDKSAMIVRQGNHLLLKQKWEKNDLTFLADRVTEYVLENGADYVVIDGVGVGAGVVDMLKRSINEITGIIEFNGAGKATDPKYGNARAESWGLTKDWLKTASLEEDQDWLQLTAPDYFYNNSGRIMLESKDSMKKRGIPSPDVGDALSMTMVAPERKFEQSTESLMEASLSYGDEWA